MPNTIAEYYTDELIEWNKSIIFYNSEVEEFTQKLAEVIMRNSIPHIAAKVEAHQTLLNRVSDKLHKLQTQIQDQLPVLKTDSRLIDDTLINTETEKRQNELRRKMQAAVKEYIDVKFDCYNFLSGTLKK